MNAMRLVVIGNGMVGQRLLERLAAGHHGFSITVLAEEPRPAYDRVGLTSFFSARSPGDLSLVPEGFFEANGITLHLSERAVSIDREARTVMSSTGRVIGYDRLVLATGSIPFVPPIPGRERPQCFVYRTIEDLLAIREAARHARSGAVIGGGLLGLEAAKALLDLGLETHVVEFAPRLMAVQVDEGGGRVLRRHIEALGVRVHTGKSTTAIDAGTRRQHVLRFADGESVEADLVVFSAGIRPQDALARGCGLEVGPRGGIVIDDACRTSDENIFAIGECALWQGRLFGLVAPGYQMAEVAANALLGRDGPRFAGADMSTKLKLMGVDVASLGDAHASTPEARCCTLVDERAGVYKKVVLSADGKRLLGGILVGDAGDYGTWLQLMLNALPLPSRPESMLVPAGEESGAGTGTGVAALPAGAQICSCNNVSKGAICAAVAEGVTTLGGIKKATRAASTCGGCAPLVTQVIKAELAARGVAVNNHICEHFPYSRQELFHLVKAGRITSFAELLHRHGKGLGCDICKPAVASILASQYNEFVLKPDQAVLQDTNDYYLANMQKDGSYSVVPRIPGGEITPDKLLVIAQVAKKYGLYTKITGGQRIDLFGAQVNQLPQIWEELIAAGFESGHAYGKALRTVKSCVGSTWCRYGVQDSVGFAIELENRYKGLRSPHKLKFAVSGCTRECAEAQGKDVGVIATEKGWNLYVCGNGGMKPRHAQLLAADLDRDTLVRYVDRFLMFYVRTADRLQRTSVWLENLEGGLEYLKSVVIDDSLGICALVDGEQVALLRVGEEVFALENRDPFSGANVMARGLVGDLAGQLVVASLVYKQHFNLRTGRCLEDEAVSLRTWPCGVLDGRVWVESRAPATGAARGRRRLVVVGNGMAAMRTVEELLVLAGDEYQITVFGAEPRGNYSRILLSPLLAGEVAREALTLHPLEWYREKGIALHAGDPVVSIDRRSRRVISASGVVAGYDRLLLATGSDPVRLKVTGHDLPGVFSFRSIDDVDAMLAQATSARRAVVVGGGLLGLEAASGLARQGLSVTVVHIRDRVMDKQLDEEAARLLRHAMEARGIRFCMPARTAAFEGKGRVEQLRMEDGRVLAADMVVVAAGITPRTELARSCGLKCDRGILVDDTLQTYDPSIYAVGECVQHRGTTYGLVAPLWEQARVCAAHLAELIQTQREVSALRESLLLGEPA